MEWNASVVVLVGGAVGRLVLTGSLLASVKKEKLTSVIIQCYIISTTEKPLKKDKFHSVIDILCTVHKFLHNCFLWNKIKNKFNFLNFLQNIKMIISDRS